MRERNANDLCDAGHPVPIGACPVCGSTQDEDCKLYDDLSRREVRENHEAYMRGEAPPHR